MAELHIAITGDSSGFISAANRAKGAAGTLLKNVKNESEAVDEMFKKLAKGAAAFGAAFSAKELISSIASVRGEYQQLEIAFETMLGSKEKADKLMAQMTETAAKTPFGLQEVSGGAKQLLAYGIAAEDVNETLVRLGDIASGLSIPLGDMVYLFGTTKTQGRMFTQDMRQFMGRGIPLAEELAKMFGKSKDEISKMVTEGKIGFEEMKNALWSMTGEGGKFYNLMEKQSSSITGQISNLQDQIDMMFNELGKKSEGAIYTALSAASWLVEHYEAIGKTIIGVATAYGVYKASVVATIAIEKVAAFTRLASIKSMTTMGLAMESLAKKSILLRALSNPFVALASVVGGAIVTFALLNDKYDESRRTIKECNKELKKQNEALKELEKREKAVIAAEKQANEEVAGQVSSIEQLVNAIHDESSSLADRKKAIAELQRVVPDYHATLDEEGRLHNENTQAVDQYIESLQRMAYAKALQSKREQLTAEKVNAELERREAKQREDKAKADAAASKSALDTAKQTAAQIESANQMGSAMSIGGGSTMWLASSKTTKAERLAYAAAEKELEAAQGAVELADKKIEAATNDLTELDKMLKDYTKELDTINKGGGVTPSGMTSPIGAAAAERQYSVTMQKRTQKLLSDMENEEIAAMTDGIEKAQRLREKANEEELNAIAEQKKAVIREAVEKDKKIFESVQQAKKIANKNYVVQQWTDEDEKKAINKFLNNGGEEILAQYDALMEQVRARQAKEAEDAAKQAELEYLVAYGTLEEKLDALSQIWDIKIAKAETDYERLKLTEDKNRELQELREKSSASYQDIFADPSKMSLSSITDAIALARSSIKKITSKGILNEEEIQSVKDLQEAIDRLQEYAESAPFINLGDGLDGVISKLNRINFINDKIQRATADNDQEAKKQAEEELAATKEQLEKNLIGVGVEEFAHGLTTAADAMREIAEISGDTKLAKTADVLNSVGNVVSSTAAGAATGGPLGAIAGAVTSVFSEITDAIVSTSVAAATNRKAMEDYAKSMRQLALEINEDVYDTIWGESVFARIDELNQKIKMSQKELAKIGKQAKTKEGWYIEGNSKTLGQSAIKQKGGKDTTLSKMFPEIFDKDGNLDLSKIEQAKEALESLQSMELKNDEGRKLLGDAIEVAELVRQYQEELSQIAEDYLGSIGSSIGDAIVDGILRGEDALETFRDSAAGIIEQIARDFASSWMIDNYLSNFNESMQAAFASNDPMKIQEIVGAIVQGLPDVLEAGQDAAKQILDATKGTEYDVYQRSDRESTSQGIAQASQQSVDDLNGRMTAIQSHTFSINERVGNIVNMTAEMLTKLTSIDSNTSRLALIEQSMDSMKADINNMYTHGIRIKG